MKRLLLLVMAVLLVAPATQAALIPFHVTLSPANEVPPTASSGTGSVQLVLDTTAQTLTGDIVFANLASPTTAAHIHCCLASPFLTGVNVGVATVLPAFPNFPLGVTSGIDHFVLQLNDASAYNPAFVTAQGSLPQAEASFISGLVSGRTYLNIHTQQFGGGEIRGFVVPEPMTISLIGLGLAAAGCVGRRRRPV